MKICYFNGGIEIPAVRERMPFFRLLERRGHQCTYADIMPSRYDQYPWIGVRLNELISKTVRRWQISEIADEKHASVVLETEIFHTDSYAYEKILRRAAGRLVYEMDDSVFVQFPKKAEAICKMADRVITLNQNSADWAMQFNECVTVIPPCVDSEVFKPRQAKGNDGDEALVVGWIGSSQNVSSLSQCAAALRQVASQRKFQLRILTDDSTAVSNVDLDGVDVVSRDAGQCQVVAEMQQFDLGIMPLPPLDPVIATTANAKLIELMAVGVPTIASAVGFDSELVTHDQNVLLVKDHDQWIDALNTLLDSAERRATLGRSARQWILDRYSLQGRIEDYERAVLGAKFQPEKHQWNRQIPD